MQFNVVVLFSHETQSDQKEASDAALPSQSASETPLASERIVEGADAVEVATEATQDDLK